MTNQDHALYFYSQIEKRVKLTLSAQDVRLLHEIFIEFMRWSPADHLLNKAAVFRAHKLWKSRIELAHNSIRSTHKMSLNLDEAETMRCVLLTNHENSNQSGYAFKSNIIYQINLQTEES